MLLQVTRLIKRLWTKRTAVGSLTYVNTHEMFAHVERFSKCFGTLCTLKGFLASVHFQMASKSARLDKGLCALGTTEGLLSGVYSHVVLKR